MELAYHNLISIVRNYLTTKSLQLRNQNDKASILSNLLDERSLIRSFKVRRLCDLLTQLSETLVISPCYSPEEEKEALSAYLDSR